MTPITLYDQTNPKTQLGELELQHPGEHLPQIGHTLWLQDLGTYEVTGINHSTRPAPHQQDQQPPRTDKVTHITIKLKPIK